MHTHSQPAFILHAQPYRETSLLLEVLTRDHGRLGMVARGVRGARAQPLRAALQPLQPLLVGWAGQGELLQLRGAEAAGPALAPQGDALLAAFYLDELLLRLLPRGEPHTAVFWRYAACLAALQAEADHVWELRRFERDLLADIGYALPLRHEADGTTPLRDDARYRYDPERGAIAVPTRDGTIGGATLRALADDRRPDLEGMRELRRLMRVVLRHHLGGRELRSWQVLGDIAARRPRTD